MSFFFSLKEKTMQQYVPLYVDSRLGVQKKGAMGRAMVAKSPITRFTIILIEDNADRQLRDALFRSQTGIVIRHDTVDMNPLRITPYSRWISEYSFGKDGAFIWPAIGLINHFVHSNAVLVPHVGFSKGRMYIMTCKDIMAGEQIFITYYTLSMEPITRERNLQWRGIRSEARSARQYRSELSDLRSRLLEMARGRWTSQRRQNALQGLELFVTRLQRLLGTPINNDLIFLLCSMMEIVHNVGDLHSFPVLRRVLRTPVVYQGHRYAPFSQFLSSVIQ